MAGQMEGKGAEVSPRPIALEEHALVHGGLLLLPLRGWQKLLDKVQPDHRLAVLVRLEHPLLQAPGGGATDAAHRFLILQANSWMKQNPNCSNNKIDSDIVKSDWIAI